MFFATSGATHGVTFVTARERLETFTPDFGTYRQAFTADFGTWSQVISARREFLV